MFLLFLIILIGYCCWGSWLEVVRLDYDPDCLSIYLLPWPLFKFIGCVSANDYLFDCCFDFFGLFSGCYWFWISSNSIFLDKLPWNRFVWLPLPLLPPCGCCQCCCCLCYCCCLCFRCSLLLLRAKDLLLKVKVLLLGVKDLLLRVKTAGVTCK